jgi:hypothetical protein
MLRLHGLLSLGLTLALVATAAAQQSPSRILRSVPLDKSTILQESTKLPARVQRQIPQPVRTQTDARTSETRTEASEPSRADARARATRHDLASTLAELNAVAPYDLSASGRYLVASDARGTGLVLIDVANRRRMRTLEDSRRRYALVEISGDARYIAAVRRDDSDRIDLWRADNGRHLAQIEAAGNKRQLEFSDDGKQLQVYTGDSEGLLFSVPDG